MEIYPDPEDIFPRPGWLDSGELLNEYVIPNRFVFS